MNVLAVVAHPDDELLGCGATLRRLADEGHNVYSCVLSANAEARHERPEIARLREVAAEASRMVGIRETVSYTFPNVQFNTVPHLEMVQGIEEAIIRFKPCWIFTHYSGDLNVDHRVTYETTMAAASLPQRLSRDLDPHLIERIYLFEIPTSTDWAWRAAGGFTPNAFVAVERTLEAKIAALRKFEGALKPPPHARTEATIRALAKVRGAQVNVEAAEAFQLVRHVDFEPQTTSTTQ
jgi:LmbE family N-acetylglucosaminyl deacetylase